MFGPRSADSLFTVHCCGRVSPLSSAASPCGEDEGVEAWGRLIIQFPQKCTGNKDAAEVSLKAPETSSSTFYSE